MKSFFRPRVPFVPQMEPTECGAASLAMVLAFHGRHTPLAEVRSACGVSRDGATALAIMNAARRYGLTPTAGKVDLSGLSEVRLPALLHWGLNHFVVLERLTSKGAEIVDPARGRVEVCHDELDRAFTGIVLTFEPGPGFEPRQRPRRNAATLRALVRGSEGLLASMIASAFLLEMLGLLFPAAMSVVVDFIVRPRQERWVAILALALTAAVILRAAVTLARDRILGGLEARLDVELATSLVEHLLALPLAFFAQRGPGDLANRCSALLAAREMVARVLLVAFDVLLVAAYAFLVLLFDVRIGSVVLALKLGSVVVAGVGRRRARVAATTRQIAASRAQSALVQAFADPEIAKAFRAEPLLLSRYAAARGRELNAQADVARTLEPAQHALTVLDAVGGALLLALGGHAVIADHMTIGALSSLLALQTFLGPPLSRVVAIFQDLSELGPLLDRVDDVLDSAREESGFWPGGSIEGAITFENVSFRYGARGPLLLDRVSFHIDAGERVAIAGASGSGKSTILKLILGFVRPLSGRILLDGRDICEYDLQGLRASIGTVLAQGTLFDMSAFENLALGVPEATPSRLHDALESACAMDVVERLPRGMSTSLGLGASRLSGGQRQRLLIARALAKQPSLFLFDEASSALDAALESRIQGSLSRMRSTMLIVAHRPSALAVADRVLLLSRGKIVQDGSFAALVRQRGPFRQLVLAQEAVR